MKTQADNKQEYIDAWNSHVDQLTSLGYPLIKASTAERDLYRKLQDAQAEIKALIAAAAEQDFPE